MPDSIDGSRLAAYLTRRCSAEEVAEIERWVAADPARAEMVREFARVWELARGAAPDWETDRAWRELVAAREAGRPARRALWLVPAAVSSRRVWMQRIAAAIVLTVGSAALWQLTLGTPDRPAELCPDATPACLALGASDLIERVTRPGERAEFQLPDGTRVALGVASRLRYAPAYGGTTREVYLEGEAYFDVPHDETRPFAVHTARAVARDLGTAFGVRAYAEADDVEVVVTEGVVALHPAVSDADTASRAAADSVILQPADLGRLDEEGRLSVEHGVDVAERLAWREGRLVLRRTPLRDALPQLNRWYGADLRLGDTELGDAPLTVTIAGDSLSDVLRLLTAALDLRAEQRGSTIVLHRQSRS